jgi:hypothetical protein
MECVKTGELRAFLDGETAGAERERLSLHLASCATCRADLELLRHNASIAQSAMQMLEPSQAEVPGLTWRQVRAGGHAQVGSPVTLLDRTTEMIRAFLGSRENRGMRIAASAMATLLVVAMLFTLSPVQTAASSFLSIFRVKNFVAISVDPATLPDLASPEQFGTFTVTGEGGARQATVAEAESLVGFAPPVPSSMPAGLEPEPRMVSVKDAFAVTYTPDLAKLRAYLATIGATDVQLPESLDGAPISAQMPASVMLLYAERGGTDRGPDGLTIPMAGARFMYIGAASSPTVNVPDGVDVEQLRSEFLKIPGLPRDLVDQLSAVDLRNSVPVPVVKGSSRDVTVQGERGLLITESSGPGLTLLWQKDGRVYVMTGNVTEQELLSAANSL